MTIDVEIRPIPATETGKRWRNWWLVHETSVGACIICGTAELLARGDKVSSHCKSYQSRDEAESDARLLDSWNTVDWEWLGAYPEGEQP